MVYIQSVRDQVSGFRQGLVSESLASLSQATGLSPSLYLAGGRGFEPLRGGFLNGEHPYLLLRQVRSTTPPASHLFGSGLDFF